MTEIPNIGKKINEEINKEIEKEISKNGGKHGNCGKDRKSYEKFFGFGEDGSVNINIDFGKVILGFIAMALGIAAFFIYLIPYVLVLSIPFALAGFVCAAVPVFSFGSRNWFRGFVPGLIGMAISGAVIWFHIYYLTLVRGSSYLGGFWF